MNAEIAHALAPTALRDARHLFEEMAGYLASCEESYREAETARQRKDLIARAMTRVMDFDNRQAMRELSTILVGMLSPSA